LEVKELLEAIAFVDDESETYEIETAIRAMARLVLSEDQYDLAVRKAKLRIK
jgi:hypothetical protein